MDWGRPMGNRDHAGLDARERSLLEGYAAELERALAAAPDETRFADRVAVMDRQLFETIYAHRYGGLHTDPMQILRQPLQPAGVIKPAAPPATRLRSGVAAQPADVAGSGMGARAAELVQRHMTFLDDRCVALNLGDVGAPSGLRMPSTSLVAGASRFVGSQIEPPPAPPPLPPQSRLGSMVAPPVCAWGS
mmetsp:Transcript_62392/g.115816  ORF Transcript_62392/g.115816 Transcript_62392/m.115816 type:complete len:191 (-) Transcript_62392:56-628(-)